MRHYYFTVVLRNKQNDKRWAAVYTVNENTNIASALADDRIEYAHIYPKKEAFEAAQKLTEHFRARGILQEVE